MRNAVSRSLARNATYLGEARVRGRLYRVQSYVGLKQSRGEEWVIGELYRLHDPPAFLPVLDEYEGSDYDRIETIAATEDGKQMRVWLYAYKGPVDEESRILSGDFLSQT